MKMMKNVTFIICLLFLIRCSIEQRTDNIPTPESHFGFEIGANKKLAHPDEMISYFTELDKLSNRILFTEVGRTTEDNPFVMAVISSEENIKNIEKFKDINAQLADPRLINDEQAAELIRQGKTIVGVNAGIHATEVGPVQASNIVAYRLASENTPEIKKILDNVILILTPMHNPDGAYMVVDWWRKYVDTEYEGSSLPYLYQKYTGHDNNRDWYFFTQKETQLTINNLYKEWHPQIVLDMHQMGSTGARLFVPPFTDPYEPNVDPILQVNVNMLGSYMLNRLTAKGFRGVESYNRYDAWTPGRAFQHYHGAIRILTETASVRIAAPIEVLPDVLKERGYLKRSVFLPLPWEGGSWRLKDIVDYNVEAVFALLENAALTRETWLSNFYEIGKKAVAEKTEPYAVILPAAQRDPYTTKWLISVLQAGMVEVHKAVNDFTADDRRFEKESAIIYMNQPYYSFAKTLLERQKYPEFRQYPGGPLKRPYDLVAHTLPLLMGVDVQWINKQFDAESVLMSTPEIRSPEISDGEAPYGFIISHETNGMYVALNRLLNEGFPVYWANERFNEGDREYPAGTVIVFDPGSRANRILEIARDLNIDLIARQFSSPLSGFKINPVKLGLYKSWSGNMNEGWTRWVMEQYEFDMESVYNDAILSGNLYQKYNTILLTNYSERQLIEGRTGNTPPEYRGGIGSRGVDNMRDFVRSGGTLITYGSSNDFAIKFFDLRVTNVLNTLSSQQRREISAPGSILRTVNDTDHPIAYGVPENGCLFYRIGSLFNVRQGRVISRYPDTSDLLLSGWLEGGDYFNGKANVVEIPYGSGRIVLIGFDPIYRAQAQASFKYIFNSIFYSAAKNEIIPGSIR